VSASGVLVVTWVLVGVVLAGYVWFVVWRVRVERRRKEAAEQAELPAKAALRTTLVDVPSTPTSATPVTEAPAPAVSATAPPTATTPAASAATVAQALAGIQLPADLAPLTTMAPRLGVGDRVAFWTDTAPIEIVGPAFTSELERLGYSVTPVDRSMLAADRDGTRLTVVLHPEGLLAYIDDKLAFTSVPERSVVVEIWIAD
jgi:hypothetical protein